MFDYIVQTPESARDEMKKQRLKSIAYRVYLQRPLAVCRFRISHRTLHCVCIESS